MQRPEDEKIIYAHLLDAPPMSIGVDLLDRDSVLLALVSSYVMANAENPLIIPFFEKCLGSDLGFIQDAQITLTQLNDMFRRYFSQMFEALCLCFEPTELLGDGLDYTKDLFKTGQDQQKKVMPKSGVLLVSKDAYASPLASHLYPVIEKEPLLNNFKGPVCAFCDTARQRDVDVNSLFLKEYKQTNVYGKCSAELVLPLFNSPNGYKLSKELGERYSSLRRFVCLDRVEFEGGNDEEKFFKKLKRLQRLELSNNGLAALPVSICKLKDLKYLAIRNNAMSIKSLLGIFKKLNHLTTLKLENLQFDLDKDKPEKIPKSLKKLCRCFTMIDELIYL